MVSVFHFASQFLTFWSYSLTTTSEANSYHFLCYLFLMMTQDSLWDDNWIMAFREKRWLLVLLLVHFICSLDSNSENMQNGFGGRAIYLLRGLHSLK